VRYGAPRRDVVLMNSSHHASRRDFLKQALTGAVLLGTGGTAMPAAAEDIVQAAKSRVAIARDAQLRLDGTTVDSTRMLGLLDCAMQAFFDRDHALDAWKMVVRSGELVSLKVNALGGRGICTNLQLVEAICERLQQAGIKASNILVWDRDTSELERAGFRVATSGSGVQCYGTDRVGYEADLVMHGTVGSRLSMILTQRTSVLINLPVLKDHDGAGVTIGMKNMYGVIHNPNKYHPDGCDPYIADLNMLPGIRSKLRLSICDATTAMYEGGPAFKPEFSWKCNALLAARDPVALDYTGWRLIERKRAEKGLKTLEAEGRLPRYIATAADKDHLLGTNDPRRISVIEV